MIYYSLDGNDPNASCEDGLCCTGDEAPCIGHYGGNYRVANYEFQTTTSNAIPNYPHSRFIVFPSNYTITGECFGIYSDCECNAGIVQCNSEKGKIEQEERRKKNANKWIQRYYRGEDF